MSEIPGPFNPDNLTSKRKLDHNIKAAEQIRRGELAFLMNPNIKSPKDKKKGYKIDPEVRKSVIEAVLEGNFSKLNLRTQEILARRFLIDVPMPHREISSLFNVSREYIRLLEKRGLQELEIIKAGGALKRLTLKRLREELPFELLEELSEIYSDRQIADMHDTNRTFIRKLRREMGITKKSGRRERIGRR
jgi:hypothetical protein